MYLSEKESFRYYKSLWRKLEDAFQQMFVVFKFLWWFTNRRERKLRAWVHWLVQLSLRWELLQNDSLARAFKHLRSWGDPGSGHRVSGYYYQLLLCNGLLGEFGKQYSSNRRVSSQYVLNGRLGSQADQWIMCVCWRDSLGSICVWGRN